MEYFYYQLSKLHQSEAKTYKSLIHSAIFLTLSYYYGEIDKN